MHMTGQGSREELEELSKPQPNVDTTKALAWCFDLYLLNMRQPLFRRSSQQGARLVYKRGELASVFPIPSFMNHHGAYSNVLAQFEGALLSLSRVCSYSDTFL
jgi:hypothetical protein